MLSSSLSSPLPSLVPPTVIRDTLYRIHHASPQEPFPLTADLQGRQAQGHPSAGNPHRLCSVAATAGGPVVPMPGGRRRLVVNQQRAEAEELGAGGESRSSSLLLAGVLAAPLSALSMLPLLNLLFKRAACLNGMILTMIINFSSES